jgi:hypothetical protein
MPSVRAQILAVVEALLDDVRTDLDWTSVVRNPRERIGEDQMNALVMMDGGDREPTGLTGHVEENWVEFSVGMVVKETGEGTAEELLDAGLVAVCDTLVDPDNIQLGGLAIGIRREGISEPLYGRADKGARILGGQAIDFAVQYLAREGDASTPGP